MSGWSVKLGSFVLALALGVFASCGGEELAYDPDWDADGPIEGGKADGILDIMPPITMGTPVEGDVGGDRVEMFWIALQRTDRIEVAMEVLDGDLNPHISLYLGTSTYVDSESWSRDGNVLRKVYAIEEAGTYLVAARAYRGEGSGRYRLTITCAGGPCNGEFPPPESDLDAGEVASCVAQARRCSFTQLPTYGGAVGEVRSRLIFNQCMSQASLEDGGSCEGACSWTGDASDTGDDTDAADLCNGIIAALPFYADQSAACFTLIDSCFSGCYGAAGDGPFDYDDADIWETVESLCWSSGFNGSCDSFARSHASCGGEIRANSSGECTGLCEATTGAHIDDLDTLCSSDSDCAEYCDVDIDAAGESCGGVSSENRDCLIQYLEDHEAYGCEDALDERLAG